MVAAQEGHLSVVELLVSMGAQVNNQNNVSSYPIGMTYRVYVYFILTWWYITPTHIDTLHAMVSTVAGIAR